MLPLKTEGYSYLDYKENNLNLYDFSAKDIIAQISTPSFLFLPDRFKKNFLSFEQQIKKYLPRFRMAYAVKANYLGAVLKQAKELGMSIEVMSYFEMMLAKEVGFDFTDMVFNGPAKSLEELTFATDNNIFFLNVESENELQNIEQIAQKKKKKQSISIRIHPEFPDKLEKKLLIKKNSKLGIDYHKAVKLYEYAKKSPYLDPVGIHVHVGTNLTDVEFYRELLGFLNGYITDLENKYDIRLQYINLGGGLASKNTLDRAGFNIEDIGRTIKETINDYNEREFVFEPGRYLVGDSFVAFAKVLRTKKTWGRKWAYLNIGANSLIPMRYSEYEALPVEYKGEGQYCNIGGPLCLPVDVLSNDAVKYEIDEGDYLTILNCGAYTLSMSEQFGYPRPPVYELHENGLINLIKKEDTIESMISESMYESTAPLHVLKKEKEDSEPI